MAFWKCIEFMTVFKSSKDAFLSVFTGEIDEWDFTEGLSFPLHTMWDLRPFFGQFENPILVWSSFLENIELFSSIRIFCDFSTLSAYKVWRVDRLNLEHCTVKYLIFIRERLLLDDVQDHFWYSWIISPILKGGLFLVSSKKS